MTPINRLSEREREVLELLLQGKSNKRIASSLGVSVRTIEFHLRNIYAKFQVSSRIELILKLGKTTGNEITGKLGYSTVASPGESAENRDRFNSRMNWTPSFRNAVSIIGRELKMNNPWNTKHVLVGAVAALLTGLSWIATLIYIEYMFPNEIRAWSLPLIVILAIIGLSVGVVGKYYDSAPRKVFFSTLFGVGLSPFTIIPLMIFIVVPLGKLAEWSGLADPSTMPSDVATTLTAITMLAIWLVVGMTIGITLLFVTIKKPERIDIQRRASERGL